MAENKKFAGGFLKLLKRKMDRKKEQDAAKKSGVPEYIMKLSGADRRRALAVHKANQKKKKKY